MHLFAYQIEATRTLNTDRSNDIMGDRNLLVTSRPAATKPLWKRDDALHACSLGQSVQ